MALTDEDIKKIEKIVKKHTTEIVTGAEDRLGTRIDKLDTKIDKVEASLLEEIHNVGVEVIENRSVILEHIHNNPAWKH